MTKSRAEFLQQLHEQSLQKQVSFLDNISTRLGRERPQSPPLRSVKGAPDYWNEMELPLEERIRLFVDNWQKAGGHVERLAGMSEAKQFIRKLIIETKAKYLVVQDQQELEELKTEINGPDTEMIIWNAKGADETGKDDLVAKAAGADIGIIAVDHAVAFTGSIIAMSSPSKGRTVSLLPTIMVAIVPVEKLKTRLGEVLRPLDQLTTEERPAGIHFISGPSRSADIENDLTIGVHGPGIVYALIIE